MKDLNSFTTLFKDELQSTKNIHRLGINYTETIKLITRPIMYDQLLNKLNYIKKLVIEYTTSNEIQNFADNSLQYRIIVEQYHHPMIGLNYKENVDLKGKYLIFPSWTVNNNKYRWSCKCNIDNITFQMACSYDEIFTYTIDTQDLTQIVWQDAEKNTHFTVIQKNHWESLTYDFWILNNKVFGKYENVNY